MIARLPRTFGWRRLDVEGHSVVRLERDDGLRIVGTEVVATPAAAWAVTFDLRVDARWRTRELAVRLETPGGRRERHLARPEHGHWFLDGVAAPELDDCVDVDIAATPLTNTLPIRRLGLPVGASVDLAVAWVGVSDLAVRNVRQGYRHLEPVNGVDRWEYRSPSGPSYLLTVDADGIVIEYERFASRTFEG